MKKTLFVSASFIMLCATAFAQLTPEGVMAKLPDIPTVAQMIDKESNPDTKFDNIYSEFHSKLEKAIRESQEMYDKSHAGQANQLKKEAMNSKVPGTNVTPAQAKNMSKDELKAMAMATAKGRMAASGVSMADLQAVQSGKMSEEELANKMMAQQTGGLTMKDIEAMQNMTEQERIEFIQQSGLAENTSAAAKKNMQNAGNDAKLAAVMQKITSLEKRISVLSQKSIKLREDARTFGHTLYDKNYKSKIEALIKKTQDLMATVEQGEQTAAEAAKAQEVGRQVAAINKQIDGLNYDFYSKYLPVWRNAVVDAMDVYRVEILPLQYELKKAYKEAYDMTRNYEYNIGDMPPFTAAFSYLEVANDIDNFNW